MRPFSRGWMPRSQSNPSGLRWPEGQLGHLPVQARLRARRGGKLLISHNFNLLDRRGILCQNSQSIFGGESRVSRKTLYILLGLVVLIAAAGIGYYLTSGSGDASAAGGQGYELVPTDRTLGNRKAKVVLIEYGAPSCPVCAHFNAADISAAQDQNTSTPARSFMSSACSPCVRTTARRRKSPAVCLRISTSPSLTCCSENQPKWDVEYRGPVAGGRSWRAGAAGAHRRHERRAGRQMHG